MKREGLLSGAKLVGADYYRSIHGWFDFEEIYADAVNRAPEDQHSIFVEVGSWLGKSACYMAQRILESKKSIRLFCVDHFHGSDEHEKFLRRSKLNLYEEFRHNIENGGYQTVVVPLQFTSHFAAKLFNEHSLDFCFIDASHDFQSVVSDIQLWEPKVKRGGILAGHDYCKEHPGVIEAVNGFFPDAQIKGVSWISAR